MDLVDTGALEEVMDSEGVEVLPALTASDSFSPDLFIILLLTTHHLYPSLQFQELGKVWAGGPVSSRRPWPQCGQVVSSLVSSVVLSVMKQLLPPIFLFHLVKFFRFFVENLFNFFSAPVNLLTVRDPPYGEKLENVSECCF